MYYEHYFYFAVNLLINTSCAFFFLPACLLAFFCTFTWFPWKDVSWLCDQENGFGPLMRVGSLYFLC